MQDTLLDFLGLASWLHIMSDDGCGRCIYQLWLDRAKLDAAGETKSAIMITHGLCPSAMPGAA